MPILRHWTGGRTTKPVPAIDTPFARAAAIVDRRDGHARLLAHYAWLVNVVLLVACFGLGLGWYGQAQKSTVEAFYVPIDALGRPAEVIPATREFTLTDAVMAAFLKRFVEETFAKSKDPVVNGQRQQFMRASVVGAARQTMIEWSKQADLDENVGSDKRTSRFLTAKQTANPMTWNVIWEETYWEEGTRVGKRRMNGDFTFTRIPPRSAADLAANPLGLYVTDLHWQVENL